MLHRARSFCLFLSLCLYKYLSVYLQKKDFIRYVLDRLSFSLFMATLRPSLALVSKTVGRRQFGLSQRRPMKDNWDQEALPGSNVPFNSNARLSHPHPLRRELASSQQQMGSRCHARALRVDSGRRSLLRHALATAEETCRINWCLRITSLLLVHLSRNKADST